MKSENGRQNVDQIFAHQDQTQSEEEHTNREKISGEAFYTMV